MKTDEPGSVDYPFSGPLFRSPGSPSEDPAELQAILDSLRIEP